MERLQIPHLLDERGQPFSDRIDRLLRSCIPKLRRQFPVLRNDELLLTEILEEGGRRLVRWEQRTGNRLDERSHRFVWTTLFNVGRSWALRDTNRLRRDTIAAEAGEAILSSLPATQWGTPQQIENAVRLREMHDHLNERQWEVCRLKAVGYTAEQIAETCGSSPDAVNMVFSRAKRKLYALLGSLPRRRPSARGSGEASPGAPSEQRAAHNEQADGELAPAPRLVWVHRRK